MAEDRERKAKQGAVDAAASEVRTEAKSRLQQLAKTLGNEEIAKRIGEGNANREQMLAFVAERLEVVKELQGREMALTQRGADFDWARVVGDHHKGVTKPEPTRWRETALAYNQAVGAMCRGDLRRGQELLERAIATEEKTRDEMTKLVSDTEGSIDAGAFAAMATLTPACGAAAEPAPIRALVDAIVAVTATVPDPETRKRVRDPWWTLEEDEDEEEPDGAGGG